MNSDNMPIWADAKRISQLFGIGKTTLYHFASIGVIRSSSLREPGKARGKRLFHVQSVADLVESKAFPTP